MAGCVLLGACAGAGAGARAGCCCCGGGGGQLGSQLSSQLHRPRCVVAAGQGQLCNRQAQPRALA